MNDGYGSNLSYSRKIRERIDKFLSEELDSLSRSYIQKLVKDGEVRVNGNAVKRIIK